MPDAQARSHSLLQLQKLLSLRDAISPFTLVLDSLEQAAGPVLEEIAARVKSASTSRSVIFVSFATVRKPRHANALIKAAGRSLATIRSELVGQYGAADAAAPTGKGTKSEQRAVVIIDSLNNLATAYPGALNGFLSSILAPGISLVACYHTDVPVVAPRDSNEYEPAPLTLLCHLATTVVRLSSLEHEVARQRARNRALPDPEWGLGEEREGTIIGLRQSTAIDDDRRALVVHMELRRRSGRTVSERFILRRGGRANSAGQVSLLTDHALFAPSGADDGAAAGDEPQSSFDMGLTDKQRRDREGIVLPYFDAQTDMGASGEGGRILYDMGREDDFDDEDEEI